MDEAVRLFEAGEFFVPELLVSARAMKSAMAVLEPRLADQPRESAGRIAIGTVAGDLHDIGKNLVATMLRGAGFDVDDLGVDVTPGQFVEASRAGADVIGISSLLTTTMISMRAVVQALEETGLRDRVKVMVGGAPVTPEYADAIGADGFSDNAGGAVTLARRLVALARPA
jgi:5-methyltetrahydrofolate--homocysteine methyltransferase